MIPVATPGPGAVAAVDLAFDAEGKLVGSDTLALFKTAQGQAAEHGCLAWPGAAACATCPTGASPASNDATPRELPRPHRVVSIDFS